LVAQMSDGGVAEWTVELEAMKASWRRRCGGDKIATGHPRGPFVRIAVNPDFGTLPAGAAEQLLEEICAIARVSGSRRPRSPRIPNAPFGVDQVANDVSRAIRKSLRTKRPGTLVVDWGVLFCAIKDASQWGGQETTGFLNRRTGEIVFVPETGREDDDVDIESFDARWGRGAAVESIFDRATLDAAPDDWIEIPKYDRLADGRDREEEFIDEFLRDNGVDATDETMAVVAEEKKALCAALIQGVARDASSLAASIGAIQNFSDLGAVESLARLADGERSMWLMEQLRYCTDIVPCNECAKLNLPPGSSYATAVRHLKRELDAAPVRA
jgi:hypothetical protein